MGVASIKIIHLIASNGIGGAERVLLDICRSLESPRLRFEVGLFVPPGREEENALGRMLLDYHIPSHFIRMHFPLCPSEIMDLSRLFRRTGASVVHCHGLRANLFGGAAARLCGIPAVSTVHGLVPISRKQQLYTWLDLKSLRLFNMVFAVSDRLREDLIEEGIPAHKVELVRNVPCLDKKRALPERSPARKGPPFRIGFVGRLSAEKGALFLLDAVARLRKTIPVFLHLVGDGPEMPLVTGRIAALGLEDAVKVYGYVADPAEIYDALDVLVLPSLTEGIPLTLLEGMSLGLPVIASKVGGIPEVIEEGKSGILIPPESVSALADNILLLAQDPDLRERLGNGARARVTSLCDHRAWERRIEKVYERHGGGNDAFS